MLACGSLLITFPRSHATDVRAPAPPSGDRTARQALKCRWLPPPTARLPYLGASRPAPSRETRQARLVEALLQAGLALVLPAQREEAAREHRRLALPFSHCSQVAEQGHGSVVFTRVLRLDQRPGPLPGNLKPGFKFVKVPSVRGSLGRSRPGLLFAATFLLGLQARRFALIGRFPQVRGGPG